MSGLLPKEHGAYAQLGFPLLTGLIYAGGAPGAVAFAVAAVAFFLAHEPVAILAGVRGRRLREQHREAARRRLLFLAGVALAGLGGAALLAPGRAWLGALLPGAFAALLLPALGTRRMKTIPSEVLAAAAFSTAGVPLALAGGAGLREALIAAAVWFGAILPAIFAVHAIKAGLRRRPEERWILRVAPWVAAAVVVGALVGALLMGARELLAALVPAGAILGLELRLPHPRHLKRVGWTLVAADTAALLLLLSL